MSKTHYAGLDGLRGFAALSVVLFHLGHWWHIPQLATNSGLAVDLFFCLSGYVLPLAYGGPRHRDLTSLGFAKTRLIRLMPVMVLATLVSAAYVFFRLIVKHDFDMAPSLYRAIGLGMVSLPYFDAPAAIGGPQVFPLNGPQYTLFLELVVNAAWFATRRVPQVPLALAVAGFCILILALFGAGGDTGATFWLGFPRVGASFFIGVALFHIAPQIASSKQAGGLFALACLVMVGFFYMPVAVSPVMVLVWIVAVSPLLVVSGAMIAPTGPWGRACIWAGALSYPLYALHYPIFSWINGALQTGHVTGPALEFAPVLVGIIVLSTLSARPGPCR